MTPAMIKANKRIVELELKLKAQVASTDVTGERLLEASCTILNLRNVASAAEQLAEEHRLKYRRADAELQKKQEECEHLLKRTEELLVRAAGSAAEVIANGDKARQMNSELLSQVGKKEAAVSMAKTYLKRIGSLEGYIARVNQADNAQFFKPEAKEAGESGCHMPFTTPSNF